MILMIIYYDNNDNHNPFEWGFAVAASLRSSFDCGRLLSALRLRSSRLKFCGQLVACAPNASSAPPGAIRGHRDRPGTPRNAICETKMAGFSHFFIVPKRC